MFLKKKNYRLNKIYIVLYNNMNFIEKLEDSKKTFPQPISTLSGELLYELSSNSPNYMRIFLLEIDLFEISVLFFSFIQIMNIYSNKTRLKFSFNNIKELYNNDKLCTGNWWGLLRETSRDIIEANKSRNEDSPYIFISQMYYDTIGKKQPFSSILDKIPGLRNKLKGHSWTLSNEKYEYYVKEISVMIESLFVAIKQISELSIIYVISTKEFQIDRNIAEILVLNGDDRRPLRRVIKTEQILKTDRVYIIKTSEIDNEPCDFKSILSLHPFIIYKNEKNDINQLYFFQAFCDKKITYQSSLGGKIITDEINYKEFEDIIKEIEKLSEKEENSESGLYGVIKKISNESLSSQYAKISYDPKLYFVRDEVIYQINKFFESKFALCILTAQSGIGKSALACHLTNNNIISESNSLSILLIFAQELSVYKNSLDVFLKQKTGQNISELSQNSCNKRVIIIIDSIEKVSYNRDIIFEITNFIKNKTNDNLQILISLTDIVYREIKDNFYSELNSDNICNISLPSLNEIESKKIFQLIANDDIVLSESIFKIFKTPLQVKIALSVTKYFKIDEISPAKIYYLYSKQKIFNDFTKSQIINEIIDLMIMKKEKTLLIKDIVSYSNWLKSFIFSQKEKNPFYELIDDHIIMINYISINENLPIPEEISISIPFEQLLDYLVFTRIFNNINISENISKNIELSSFQPVIGSVIFFCIEFLLKNNDKNLKIIVDFILNIKTEIHLSFLKEFMISDLSIINRELMIQFLKTIYNQKSLSDNLIFQSILIKAISDNYKKNQFFNCIIILDFLYNYALADFPEEVIISKLDWLVLSFRFDNIENILTQANEINIKISNLNSVELKVKVLSIIFYCYYHIGDNIDSVFNEILTYENDIDLSIEMRFEIISCKILFFRMKGFYNKINEGIDNMKILISNTNVILKLKYYIIIIGDMLAKLEFNKDKDFTNVDELFCKAYDLTKSSNSILLNDLNILSARRYQGVNKIESYHIEEALSNAIANNDKLTEARALSRRGTLNLKIGNFEQSLRDAEISVKLFKELGYKKEYLRTILHISSVVEWELGRIGKSLSYNEEIFNNFQNIVNVKELILSGLIIAEIYYEIRNKEKALFYFNKIKEIRDNTIKKDNKSIKKINFDLVNGMILEMEGDFENAINYYKKALEWGYSVNFDDFIFQPAIKIIRLLLEINTKESIIESKIFLDQIFEDKKIDPSLRNRYLAELYILHALINISLDREEELTIWIEEIEKIFQKNNNHRLYSESLVITQILLLRYIKKLENNLNNYSSELNRSKESISDEIFGRKSKLKSIIENKILKRIKEDSLNFVDLEDRRAYLNNNPATKLLKKFDFPFDIEKIKANNSC